MTTDPLCVCGHPLSMHSRLVGLDKLTGETVQHCLQIDDRVGSEWCHCRRFQPAAEGRKENDMPTNPTDEEIEDRFRYHAPTAEACKRHEAITEASIAFAKVIRDNVPFSRGQSLALSAAEEARMWANQGIATNHDKLGE